jgi:hypothetical protein
MNCQEFWNTMPTAGSDHPHLRECAGCVARMKRAENLSLGLRALAASMSRTEAPSRVEAGLLSAFRAQPGQPQSIRTRRRWIPAATWAAAIAAMIAIGVFLVSKRAPAEVERTAPRGVELAMLETPATGFESAIEEGYLLLPGAAQLGSAEGVNILHVELRRSAMMQVGIEVSPERADEAVQADVMVGSDGLARAVRFVDTAGSD